MRLHLYIVIISSLLLSNILTQNDLSNLLKTEVSHLASNPPDSPERFINSIQSNGDMFNERFNIVELNDILLNKYSLPQQVVDKFKGIAFSKTLTFQSFCFVLSGNESSLEEFVGAARNIDDVIDIIFIKVNSYGNVVQQYGSYNERKCKRIIFWKKCHNETKYYPRGFDVNELNVITQALRWNGYNFLVNKLNQESNTLQLLFLN